MYSINGRCLFTLVTLLLVVNERYIVIVVIKVLLKSYTNGIFSMKLYVLILLVFLTIIEASISTNHFAAEAYSPNYFSKNSESLGGIWKSKRKWNYYWVKEWQAKKVEWYTVRLFPDLCFSYLGYVSHQCIEKACLTKCVFIPVWKKVWTPIDIKEWIPVPNTPHH